VYVHLQDNFNRGLRGRRRVARVPLHVRDSDRLQDSRAKSRPRTPRPRSSVGQDHLQESCSCLFVFHALKAVCGPHTDQSINLPLAYSHSLSLSLSLERKTKLGWGVFFARTAKRASFDWCVALAAPWAVAVAAAAAVAVALAVAASSRL